MSVRLPLTQVLNAQNQGNLGASSVAGGIAHTFYIPQDTDNVTVKMTASVAGGGVSATFQTTDDGGTTWYDVARTSITSRANNTTPEWLSVPVVSSGVNPLVASNSQAGSVLGGTIGTAAASTLGSRQVSGLPLLSTLNRIFLITTAATTLVTSVVVQVKVNSQSAGN